MPRRICKEARICEKCGLSFLFQKCYAKRPGTPGRFCSNSCRLSSQLGRSNPNISELGRRVGPKAAKEYRYKQRYEELRRQALDLLTRDHTKMPVCLFCGCSRLELLQVNHKNGGGHARKENGVTLWRMVLKLGSRASEFFDVRCAVCNWTEFVERTNPGVKYRIEFVEGEKK